MVDLICRKCGRPFNLGEDVYRRRKSRGEPGPGAPPTGPSGRICAAGKNWWCAESAAHNSRPMWRSGSSAPKRKSPWSVPSVPMSRSPAAAAAGPIRKNGSGRRTCAAAACRSCARIVLTFPSPARYVNAAGKSSGRIGTGWRPPPQRRRGFVQTLSEQAGFFPAVRSHHE